MCNVHKLPVESYRENVRLEFPSYEGMEALDDAVKQAWQDRQDTYSIPTGMFKDDPNCKEKDVTFYASIYNNLGAIMPKRRNPEYEYYYL